MAEPLDAYKVMQVDPEAEGEVIQAAYRRLARKYHPDLASGPEAAPSGRAYREEVDSILRSAGRRSSASTEATERRGLFRRR
jgi:curved DNA-binding protein CbpA